MKEEIKTTKNSVEYAIYVWLIHAYKNVWKK